MKIDSKRLVLITSSLLLVACKPGVKKEYIVMPGATPNMLKEQALARCETQAEQIAMQDYQRRLAAFNQKLETLKSYSNNSYLSPTNTTCTQTGFNTFNCNSYNYGNLAPTNNAFAQGYAMSPPTYSGASRSQIERCMKGMGFILVEIEEPQPETLSRLTANPAPSTIATNDIQNDSRSTQHSTYSNTSLASSMPISTALWVKDEIRSRTKLDGLWTLTNQCNNNSYTLGLALPARQPKGQNMEYLATLKENWGAGHTRSGALVESRNDFTLNVGDGGALQFNEETRKYEHIDKIFLNGSLHDYRDAGVAVNRQTRCLYELKQVR